MNGAQNHRFDRREFIERAAAGTAAATLVGGTPRPAEAHDAAKPIRIGVIGVGPRGQWHLRNLLANYAEVTIPAICDIREDRLNAAIEMVKKARGTQPVGYAQGEHDYRNLCA